MTFDQAKEAFREHKTCRNADAYLDHAVHHKVLDLIGAEVPVQRRWRSGKLAFGV